MVRTPNLFLAILQTTKAVVSLANQIGDTINNIFGRTYNPHRKDLSPGGSSGGEGALIALKGSILGVVRCAPSLSLWLFLFFNFDANSESMPPGNRHWVLTPHDLLHSFTQL